MGDKERPADSYNPSGLSDVVKCPTFTTNEYSFALLLVRNNAHGA